MRKQAPTIALNRVKTLALTMFQTLRLESAVNAFVVPAAMRSATSTCVRPIAGSTGVGLGVDVGHGIHGSHPIGGRPGECVAPHALPGSTQPFVAPARRPRTKNRWSAKNTISGARIDRKVPAACRNHWLPHVPDSDARDWVIGSDDDGANIVATSRSFQTQMNSRTANDASAGAASGQDHPEEDLAVPRAVDPCRLDDLARDLRDEVVQQEHRERQREDRVRDPHGGEAVVDLPQVRARGRSSRR